MYCTREALRMGSSEDDFCIVITKMSVSKMCWAKMRVMYAYGRDIFRWIGGMNVSNSPFPREMGGQKDVYRGLCT